ncbi:MAG: metallophosphoesterase [Candidatus Woesearchaeota archaeon]
MVITLTLSYVIAASLESYSDNAFFRAVYTGASLWMGMLFMSFCILLIYLLIELFTPITNWITGAIILGLVLLLTVYGMINAFDIYPRTIEVYNDKGVDMKVVQISDLHLGPINGERYLKRVVREINKLHPDVVLITGDLLDGKYHYADSIFKPLNDINATVYVVTGNHDIYAGLDRFERFLNTTKAEWISDEVVRYKDVHIVGLDDSPNKHHVGTMLRKINEETPLNTRFTLLMNHRPIGWKNASKYVDLMISGHVHAGQIWPFSYLSWLENRVIQGIYTMPGDTHFMLYVTSGTGTWGPPIRIGSRTEIVLYNIHALHK